MITYLHVVIKAVIIVPILACENIRFSALFAAKTFRAKRPQRRRAWTETDVFAGYPNPLCVLVGVWRSFIGRKCKSCGYFNFLLNSEKQRNLEPLVAIYEVYSTQCYIVVNFICG